MQVLNVAEKNDAAKCISAILSGNKSKIIKGRSVYNKNYAFSYRWNNRDRNFVFTSVSGHLLDLEFDKKYSNWNSCDPTDLYSAKLVKFCPDMFKDTKNNIVELAKKSSDLIIWTDCDREGENIGVEVEETVKLSNPRIRVHRAVFSEITYRSVTNALANLVKLDKNKSDAVEARREIDLRVGASFTRLLTLRLREKFPKELAGSTVSYGLCQFPTLGFVVQRYKEIERFIAEKFWKITVFHKKLHKNLFIWSRDHIFSKEIATAIHQKLLKSNQATVIDKKSKSKTKFRPLPLDTATLEKAAVRFLGINAKEAMKISEKLYTKGFISYPRTETNHFSPNINLINATKVFENYNDTTIANVAIRILNNTPNPRKGSKNDGAHPPIYPLKILQNGTKDEQKIYDYVLRHFLACCDKDAKANEECVTIEISDEKFAAIGLNIVEKNYLEVFPFDKWTDKVLDDYEKKEKFKPTSIDLNNGATTPPNLLTEADLITLMEKYEIGTDATHAEHIDTIKNRGYALTSKERAQRKNVPVIYPSKFGMALYEGFDMLKSGFTEPFIRSQLEKKLVEISDGRINKGDVLSPSLRTHHEKLNLLKSQVRTKDFIFKNSAK